MKLRSSCLPTRHHLKKTLPMQVGQFNDYITLLTRSQTPEHLKVDFLACFHSWRKQMKHLSSGSFMQLLSISLKSRRGGGGRRAQRYGGFSKQHTFQRLPLLIYNVQETPQSAPARRYGRHHTGSLSVCVSLKTIEVTALIIIWCSAVSLSA